MLKGMNACAFSVLIVGWARVGALSVAAVASAAKAAVTPAELTPRHSSTAMVSTREISRSGLSAPLLVSMTVGSSANGTANPPADPVSDMARSASTVADRPNGLDLSGVEAQVAVHRVDQHLPECSVVGRVSDCGQVAGTDPERVVLANQLLQPVSRLVSEQVAVTVDFWNRIETKPRRDGR